MKSSTAFIFAALSSLSTVECSLSYIRGGMGPKVSSLDQVAEPIQLTDITADEALLKYSPNNQRRAQSNVEVTPFTSQVNKTYAFPIGADPDCAAGHDMVVGVTMFNIEAIRKDGTMVFSNTLRWLFEPLILELDAMIDSPRVIYDSDRSHFIVAATLTDRETFSKIVVAVSKTGTPMTGTSDDWYYIVVDSWEFVAQEGDTFASDLGLALDSHAIYITASMKKKISIDEDEFVHSKLFTLDKNPLLSMKAGVNMNPGFPVVASNAISNAVLKTPIVLEMTIDGNTRKIGPYYPATIENEGSKQYGKFGTYLVAYNTDFAQGDDEELHVIRISVPTAERGPTVSEYIVNIGDVDDTSKPLEAAPQPDEDYSGVETGDRKVQSASWYKEKLYVALTVLTSSGQSSAYWVTIDAPSTSTAPTELLVAGSGSSGLVGASGLASYYPSIAVNMNEQVLVGFGASGDSANTFPGMYATLASDSSLPAVVLQQGEANLESIDGYTYLGEYSGNSVDPSDQVCFWVFNTHSRDTSRPEDLHIWARGALATAWSKVCP